MPCRLIAAALYALLALWATSVAAQRLTDADIRKLIIQQSISSY
jgi:hypothetical protein